MANSKLLDSLKNVKNEAGGVAHKLTPMQTLALLSTTSCLNNTTYVTGEKQLGQILQAALQVEPSFVAKCAVYSRELYHMKDVPALLLAVLAARKENALLRQVFSRVIDNGEMLRNFFEFVRSGVTGRKSFGTAPKQLMVNWFNSHTPAEIWQQSVGTPSFKDILRCIRPRPLDRTRSALYAWFVDKNYDFEFLPEKLKSYEEWKEGKSTDMPKTDFRMYTNRPLSTEQWTTLAKMSSWFWLMRNLATMLRHQVFTVPGMVEYVANRLGDEAEIKKSRVFPYQIMTAYQNTVGLPNHLKGALERAMEIATRNVPSFPASTVTGDKENPPAYVFTDVSGSMKNPVTGHRAGSTTVTRCVDVAALLACCFLRNNPTTDLSFFNTKVVPFTVDPTQTVMSNASNIGKIADGGTACSAPLKALNDTNRHGDLLICISDNQSWCESMNTTRFGRKAEVAESQLQMEWKRWKQRNPNAKMVCIDVAPYATTQVQEMKDVLNIGGFSDNVFKLIKQFIDGDLDGNHVVGEIAKVDLKGKKLKNTSEETEVE